MASAIPILEPSASLRDVIFARNAAQESQQFLAATMVDTGKRIAAEIGLNAAKNEAQKLAPMLQMRYLDAYNDIAGGNTASGLAKTMTIGAEVSTNPFLQRLAEQGNTLAAQMAQQVDIMERTKLTEKGREDRFWADMEADADARGDRNIETLLETETAALNAIQKQAAALQEQNERRAVMGEPPLDGTQIQQQYEVQLAKVESLKGKLSQPKSAPIPFGAAAEQGDFIEGELPTDPDGLIQPPSNHAPAPWQSSPNNPDNIPITDGSQQVTPATTPAPAQGGQPIATTPDTVGQPIEFTVYGTRNPEIAKKIGGQFVWEATPEARGEIRNKKTREEMYATAAKDKATLAETPEYKSIYNAFEIISSDPTLQNVAVAMGGVANMDYGFVKNDIDGKEFAMTLPDSNEMLSGPRAPNGAKTQIIVNDKAKDDLLTLKATMAKAREGDAIPLAGKWQMKFSPYGETVTTEKGTTFTPETRGVPNPEWGDRLPPNITQEDVAKMLTDVGVPPTAVPRLIEGATAIVRNAFDSLTGDGWDSAAADAIAADVEGGPKKIMEAAKGPLIESLKGIKGIKIEAPVKGEKKKTALDQALSAESPAPSWITDIGPAVTDTLKAAGDSFQIATKGTRAWQDYQTVKDKFQNGLISEDLYNEAMKELETRWEEIGSEVPFSELENKTNPLLKIGLLKKKQG